MERKPPSWPLVVLALLWVGWFVVVLTSISGSVAFWIVVFSLPIIGYDVLKSKKCGVLDTQPYFVVPAILLMWVFTLPAYILYRFYLVRP